MPKGEPTHWLLGKRVIPVAAAVILLCVLGTSWITFDRVRTVIEAERLVAHTSLVSANLEAIYGKVAAAESDHRAYLLTLDSDSFRRYKESRKLVEADLRTVADLTRDNPRQSQPLVDLGLSIAARYNYMEGSVKERNLHGLDRAIELLSRRAGMQAMDSIRAEIQQLTSEEDRLLNLRRKATGYALVEAEVAFAVAMVISVVLISTFAYLANRLIRQRESAAEEERLSRANLEREVERTRAAESRLERTMIELRRSNEELQNFAFVASHDLQEPLRKIRAFSDRVRRRSGDSLDDESKDSLIRVEAAADRMQRLILDLLDLSRITTKVRPHSKINMDAAIAEVADDLQTRLDETGGRVEFSNLPTVVMDPAQLRQLMQNLIANALKFRREGVAPVVKIDGVKRADGRVNFTVSDNGIGFDPKYADRIFIVFQRLHGRGEYEGSGIGLAIVRKIIERQGGSIEAQGQPDQGATFLFDLPGEFTPTQVQARIEAGDSE